MIKTLVNTVDQKMLKFLSYEYKTVVGSYIKKLIVFLTIDMNKVQIHFN